MNVSLICNNQHNAVPLFRSDAKKVVGSIPNTQILKQELSYTFGKGWVKSKTIYKLQR